jgi:hypothetical protein
MRFCTGLFFSNRFDTEIFSASVAEFKGVSAQNCAADFTDMGFHPQLKRVRAKVMRPVSSMDDVFGHSSLTLTLQP